MPPIERNFEREIIDFGLTTDDLGPRNPEPEVLPAADLGLPFPQGLAPEPYELDVEPDESDPMPQADYLAITWTIAEQDALADVLTPGYSRNNWYRYSRRYSQHYRPLIRGGAPSIRAARLGSYLPAKVGGKSVICFKSELHMNQDGIRTGDGTATLPVKDMFEQLIQEVNPKLVITVGTAGATFPDHELGDVMITRGAKYRCAREFKNEAFNGKSYRCDFEIPMTQIDAARRLLDIHGAQLDEPDFGPPTKKYAWQGGLISGPKNSPDFKIDGVNFDEFHPMLTTDFFEFGTSSNKLEDQGCGVEMGDAVLGMVCEEMGDSAPLWLVIRNASDPQINGDLPDSPRSKNMQAHWAVWYYETFGYWTSVNSAIATWAIIAGHEG